MLLPSNQEAVLLADLKSNGRGAQLKAVMANMLDLAKHAAVEGKDGKAGQYYAALAHFSTKNQNLPMRAARSEGLFALLDDNTFETVIDAMLDLLCDKVPEFADQSEALYHLHLLLARLALAPVFGVLDATVRGEIAPHMHMQSVKAGEITFHENDVCNDVYLLCNGAVAINLEINQEEHLYKTIRAGALIGEISVTTNGRRSNTARAISDCRLAKLDGDIYQRLFNAHEVLSLELELRKKAQVDHMHAYVRGLKSVASGNGSLSLLHGLWGPSIH